MVAEAARVVVDHGADIVDINMGCWVPKIAKKGGGAALLRDVKAATAVVEAVVKAVAVPVTVKVRSGFEDGVVTAVPFAVAAEAVGAQAVAVHARFAGQGHGGAADWDVIAAVKDAVRLMPIIGNGDVHSGRGRPPHARRHWLQRRDDRSRRSGTSLAIPAHRALSGNWHRAPPSPRGPNAP